MAKTFAIMGATGRIGSVCAAKLLKKGHQVRALGRNVQKLWQLQKEGAKIYTGNFDDSSLLAKVFDGAHAVFSFLPTAYDVDDTAEYEGIVSKAIIKALIAAHVPSVVNLSSIGAYELLGAGATLMAHYRHEQELNNLDLSVVHVRPGWFMENFYGWTAMIKSSGKIASSLRADLPLPMICTRDIGAKVAEFLEEAPRGGHIVFEYVGPREVTLAEAAKILGNAIHMPSLAYTQVSRDESEKGMLKRGLKPAITKIILDLNEAWNSGRMKTTQIISAPQRGKTSLQEFAQEYALHFRN